nr:MAG TPA: hypothetical protein [Caudoviricetes sp.]
MEALAQRFDKQRNEVTSTHHYYTHRWTICQPLLKIFLNQNSIVIFIQNHTTPRK